MLPKYYSNDTFFHRSIVKHRTQKSWWDEANKWRVGKTFPNAIHYLAEIKILGKDHYVEKVGRHFKFFFLFTSTAWLWKPVLIPLVFHVLQTFLRRVKIWIISNSNLVRSPSRWPRAFCEKEKSIDFILDVKKCPHMMKKKHIDSSAMKDFDQLQCTSVSCCEVTWCGNKVQFGCLANVRFSAACWKWNVYQRWAIGKFSKTVQIFGSTNFTMKTTTTKIVCESGRTCF